VREMGRKIYLRERHCCVNLERGRYAMQTEIRNQEKDSRNTFTADRKK